MAIDAMARALALNKENASASLIFRPPFLPLLDATHCSAWEDELRTFGTRWECRLATPDLWTMLPSSRGLYMFVWRPQFGFDLARDNQVERFGWILYIGITGAGRSKNTFKIRYKQEYTRHLEGDPAQLFVSSTVGRREELLARYLTLRPLEYWYTEITDTTMIIPLEKQLIRTFSPPLNQHHAVLTKAALRPAFRRPDRG